MIRTELLQISEANDPWDFRGHGSALERRGFGRQMDHEEMLDAFDVSLNANTIVLFFAIGLGTVAVSTVIPVVYITKMNAKKILLHGKVE